MTARPTRPSAFIFLVPALLAVPAAAGRLRAVTITEIMYHPAAASEQAAGQRNLEWIEIHNEDPTVINLSGYFFSEGIAFTFPPDTYLEGGAYLVVCADERAVRDAYGITNTTGNFTGRLDSSGERLALNIFGGGPEVVVRYSDRGQWPQTADGTGFSLVLKDPYLDPDDNDSWTWSALPGGTPGAPNFPEPVTVETVIIEEGEVWRYLKGTGPFPPGWQDLGFDDSSWLSGPTGIGYGDGDDATQLTDMQNGYLSFAARKAFTLEAAQIESLENAILQVSFDDGFVAYLNGVEIARESLGTPGTPVPFDQTAELHEASGLESFEVSRSLLRAGTNVLAAQVHNNSLGSTDASFVPRLTDRRVIEPGGSRASLPLVINEVYFRTSGERWVEFYNPSRAPVDASGAHLSDDRNDLGKWTLPAGSVLAPGGFLVFTGSQTGLDLAGPEVALYLSQPDLAGILDAQVFEDPPLRDPPLAGTSDARFPDGGPFSVSTTPTPGAANEVALETRVVINEILYHPPRERAGQEFVELYNRGAGTVDLSGFRFARGISYTFPEGTVLPAGGYLVVAANPQILEEAHGLSGVHGPYEGVLSDRGELVRLVDPLGNTADEVRYAEDGRWPEWADGGGSSLELVDPRQENGVALAWEASDESAKSEWEEVSYTITGYTQQAESELQIRMLEAGEVLADAVSLQRGGLEYIGNGGFEAGTGGWIIEGNHIQSHRTTEDSWEGAASLKIVATGNGDTRVNRIETETARVMTSGTYTVRLALRWLRGANVVYLSGFRQLPQTQHLQRLRYPEALGTPGARNSRFRANQGPAIDGVRHAPAVPGAGEEVEVLARIADPDGVAGAAVRYRQGSPAGSFSSVPLLDDGAHGDGAPGDGVYGATLPGQASGVKIVFYLEATDGAGGVERYPREAPERILLYQHSSALEARAFTYRLIHDDATFEELNARRLHSNELLDATFVFEESQVFQNVGTRYRGSPWNRPGNPRMYRIRFGGDAPYRGRRAINLSRWGNRQNERAAYYSVWRQSTGSATCPMSRSAFARVRTNAGTFTMEHIEPVSRDYLDLWFPDDAEGILMKITGKQVFDDNGNIITSLIEWATWGYKGTEKAQYRWNFNHRTRELEDDFTPLAALVQAMNAENQALDTELWDILDVEQFLRVYAARTLQDDWDCIAIGNGQNAYIYYAPGEGRWKFIPWDMDHTWDNASARLFPNAEATMARLITRPVYRRLYLGILDEMLNGRGGRPGYWSSAELVAKFLDRNTAAVGADGVAGADSIRSFIDRRRGSVQAQIPPRIAFRITTNGGLPFAVGATSTPIDGEAWVDVHFVAVNGTPLTLQWITTTRWRAEVPLEAGRNELAFLAFDVEGNLVGSDSVEVTSTAGWPSPRIIGAQPAEAQPGELVEVAGTDFHTGVEVLFDGTPAAEVLFDEGADPARLQARVPLVPPGVVPVVVRNVDGRSSDPFPFTVLEPPPHFIRGDVNLDRAADLADAVAVLAHLFRGAALACADAADTDDTERLELTDAVRLLEFLFRGGTPPPPPYPEPGVDPSGGALGCGEGLDLF